MGCRDGDAVCVDIGETSGDGVWEKEYRWRPVWAVVTFLPLIIWCGYRENIGDTWAYKKLFRNAGKFRRYGVLYGNSKEG